MPKLNSDLDRAISVFNGPSRDEITLSELVTWDKLAWLLKRHRELHRRAQLAESRVATLQAMFRARKNEETSWKKHFEYARERSSFWSRKYNNVWRAAHDVLGKAVYGDRDDEMHLANLIKSRLNVGPVRRFISKLW